MRAEKFNLTKYESNTSIKVDYNRAKSGDYKEREKLVEKYLPLVKRIVKRELGHIDEDIMQDMLCLLVGKAIQTFEPNSGNRFSTYYYNLAQNEIRNKKQRFSYRNHQSINETNDDGEEIAKFIPDDIDIEGEYLDKELKGIIDNIVSDLKPKHKFIIENYYGLNTGEDNTQQEIADKLGISQQAVVKHLNKVEEYIKKRLQWEGAYG